MDGQTTWPDRQPVNQPDGGEATTPEAPISYLRLPSPTESSNYNSLGPFIVYKPPLSGQSELSKLTLIFHKLLRYSTVDRPNMTTGRLLIKIMLNGLDSSEWD